MFTGTVADYIGDALEAAAPDWRIHRYPHTPDSVPRDKAVVSLLRTEIQPTPGTDLTLDHLVTINVYGSKTTDLAAQDELDGNHDLVLVALQRLGSFTWSKSSATTWHNGAIMGWQITGTISSPNIYRALINAERATP
jgi:hypothetical protein